MVNAIVLGDDRAVLGVMGLVVLPAVSCVLALQGLPVNLHCL